ncbi:MAG TPA: YihY/virulence factor BrkB family protein [Chloroflexota bacterium]|nr:YihY/virulence factor BrkB family protein [Chloroflexota bacterium]
MAAQLKHLQKDANQELNEHPGFKAFLKKLGKDNIGMLAGFLSWSILTSLVPIVVGLVAISSLFLRSPSAQQTVINHLAQALQGAFSVAEIKNLVRTTTQHSGLLGIIGLLGVLWGGSNVGGALSTAFQAIFETTGRNFIKEKLLDIAMIFVFTALMLVILVATAAGAVLNQLFHGFPLPGVLQFVIGTAISLAAAFLLFSSIYLAFPNIQPRFKWHDIWPGALLAAVLFEIITYIWPLYARFAHFNRYGAVLFPLLVLTAWIYFFSMITMIGAEVSAVFAIRDANKHGESVGPPPQDSVPQHEVIRETRPRKDGAEAPGHGQETSGGGSERPVTLTAPRSSERLVRDPAFWLLSATPLVVGTLAGVSQLLRGERSC